MLGLLINIIIMMLIFGVIYWITSIIPLPPPFRTIVNVIFGIIAIVILLGFVGWIPSYHIGHIIR